jgi:hypothetical protein
MKPKKKMPTEYDVEVWNNAKDTLLAGYNGSTALCQAIAYTDLVPGINAYIYKKHSTPSGTVWMEWGGSRPVNPPGR